tara:strand:+ start:270 stop:698 length:429 start_codon:yes stop_codon:yes gene_type:complete
MVIKEIKKNKDKGNNMKVNDEIMNKVMKQCEEDGKKNPIISKDLINKNKEGKNMSNSWKDTKQWKPLEEYKPIIQKILSDKINEVGEQPLNYGLNVDGLPIMLLKLIFGNKSSSQILKMYVDRYGYDECQSDLEWLKEMEVK